MKQLAPDKGPTPARELKINVGPVKHVLAAALVQSGACGPSGAESEAFAAAGRIGDLIARGLDRLETPADRAALAAGIKDLFVKLADRAESIARNIFGAVGSNRPDRGATT